MLERGLPSQRYRQALRGRLPHGRQGHPVVPVALLRNQQVSGSSPLAGSNKLNNLHGSSAIGDCGRVGTMWANGPLAPARASTARQHRAGPRPTPPLSRLGQRCCHAGAAFGYRLVDSADPSLVSVRLHVAAGCVRERQPALQDRRRSDPDDQAGRQHAVHDLSGGSGQDHDESGAECGACPPTPECRYPPRPVGQRTPVRVASHRPPLQRITGGRGQRFAMGDEAKDGSTRAS